VANAKLIWKTATFRFVKVVYKVFVRTARKNALKNIERKIKKAVEEI
jgi:F0F1-type ATP synthase membrane subunit b/b'